MDFKKTSHKRWTFQNTLEKPLNNASSVSKDTRNNFDTFLVSISRIEAVIVLILRHTLDTSWLKKTPLCNPIKYQAND